MGLSDLIIFAHFVEPVQVLASYNNACRVLWVVVVRAECRLERYRYHARRCLLVAFDLRYKSLLVPQPDYNFVVRFSRLL